MQGIKLGVATDAKGKAKLRVKGPSGSTSLGIEVVLHPSRRLLDEVTSGAKLVLCPHIPELLAAELAQAGVNHADANGRLFLSLKGVHVDREPKTTLHRSVVTEPELFAPKTSRIIRTLLSQRSRKSWTQAELQQRTGIAAGLVSRTLNQLVQQAFLTQEVAAGSRGPIRYRLKDFDALLDHWRAADVWRRRVTVQAWSVVARDLEEVATQVRDALGVENVVLTQWLAAWWRQPYTVPPVASFYVREPVDLKIPLSRSVTSGGNLWLIVPQDEGVFLETQEVKGFNLASDAQIYLDLLQVGQRGPDAADELRNGKGFAR